MTEKIEYDFSSLEGIFKRPEHLNEFARERMEHVRHILREYEIYNCPAHCKQCCYGSILMSYTEFTYIMLFIQRNWPSEKIKGLFQHKVGILQDKSAFLCPFLQEDADVEHCSIYAARPLICRVFGTKASPCPEAIEPAKLPEPLFYYAYDHLYYSSDNFIALNLDEELSLFEAPFALWCLADNSKETRSFLCTMLEDKGESFNAVLYEQRQKVFFVYRNGEKVMLSR